MAFRSPGLDLETYLLSQSLGQPPEMHSPYQQKSPTGLWVPILLIKHRTQAWPALTTQPPFAMLRFCPPSELTSLAEARVTDIHPGQLVGADPVSQGGGVL